MMNYTDEQIDTFLAAQGIKLLPSQRELFKKCVNNDGPIYITMPPRMGRAHWVTLLNAIVTSKDVKESGD